MAKKPTKNPRRKPAAKAAGRTAGKPNPTKTPVASEECGIERYRTGDDVEDLKHSFLDNLYFVQGRFPALASRNDFYLALAYTVRDRILDRMIDGIQVMLDRETKIACYLSAEFLVGPHLANHLLNLDLEGPVRQALDELGYDLDELVALEEEPGLGNGGLGRLAACYLDSLATLNVPAIGYGIRYEYGIFDQEIHDGWQAEVADNWLHAGNPWEIHRPEIAFTVGLGGHTESWRDAEGRDRVRWVPHRRVRGVAYDTPVTGYRARAVDLLRLWKSEAVVSFDFQAFNVGDYYEAVKEEVVSETISKVLYPNDEPEAGKELRLTQQFFFASCSLQDVLRILEQQGRSLDELPVAFAVQLNDTHPSVAVAELMRLLVDERGVDWGRAWEITRRTLAYTNHTLLPEALETWPLPLFARLLPRHLEIIYEINRRFLDTVRASHGHDAGFVSRVSLIDESGEKKVRMANLATVGSHTVNGVAAMHTELLKGTVMRDFYELYPDRFVNITNGVTPRRWIGLSNPELSALITDTVGDGWLNRIEDELPKLEAFADDADFAERWQKIKRDNKAHLAGILRARAGVEADPDSLFDVLVKRIHEYKRQHLDLLHVITLYHRIKRDPNAEITPRTVIFGGKAAPGYITAKLIIKLINSVAAVVNADPDVAGRLRVAFLPDFNVTNAQPIYPAADLSEQISMAGKEASGTGNMKFAMNGALTIGTLDGANVEIRKAVGRDNFFVFGLTAEEVQQRKARGYRPRDHYESDAELRLAIDQIGAGAFSGGDTAIFRPLVDSLLDRDEYLVLADYRSYVDCQGEVATAFQDRKRWTRMSILNAARMGYFSSDRSIKEYCEKIWKVKPLPE